MFKTSAALFVSGLLCGACNSPTREQPPNLVGATEIPSNKDISREIIFITRQKSSDFLIYDLRPNGVLILEHIYVSPIDQAEITKGKVTLQVSPKSVAQVQQLLLSVRPARLLGLDREVRPSGCKPIYDHDRGEVSVAFIDDRRTKSIHDDKIGLFLLPSTYRCNNSAAASARQVMAKLFQLLPKDDVIVKFEQAS